MKRVLIADDHPIFRSGLRQIIEEEKGYEVIAEAGDGDSCISCLGLTCPDVVVLDLAMPKTDGYGVLEWLEKNMPNVISIVISMHSSRGFAIKAKELGARAFIAKEDAAAELHIALQTPKGVFYLSGSVGGAKLPPGEPGKLTEDNSEALALLETLTPSERNIFDMVGKSMTSREIGEELGLSYRTIQTHRQHINQKLNLQGPNSLLQFALKVSPDIFDDKI